MERTEYKRVSVFPGKQNRQPGMTQYGRFHTLPRIDDGGFVLNESHAILTYLADKHNWALYPKDPQVRARIEEYLHWHHVNTRAITMAWFAPAVRPDLGGGAEFTKMQEVRAVQSLKTLNKMLGESKWLVGDVVTVADICAFAEVSQCLPEFFNLHSLDAYPNVMRWVGDCKQLPMYTETHSDFNKMLPKLLPGFKKYQAQQAKQAKL